MHINYLSLPNTIPANVAESLEAVKAKLYVTGTEPERPRFGIKQVSNALIDYLETLFPFPISCMYCFESYGFPLRTDTGNDYRILYTLDSGNDTNSNIVKIFDAPGKLLESKDVDVSKWYSITSSNYYYNQLNPGEVRITLEVVPTTLSNDVATFIANNSI